MKQLRLVWFIALKDLKLFILDRTAFLMFILFPFLFITLFSLMQVGGEDARLELHLVTREDKGGFSHEIIKSMETKDASKLKPGEPKIIWDKDYDKAYKAVKRHKLDGFLLFPSDFSEGAMMGYGAKLKVVTDAEATNTRAALNGLAHSVASKVGARQVANNATMGALIEHTIAAAGGNPGVTSSTNPGAGANSDGASGAMKDIGPLIQALFSPQQTQGAQAEKPFIEFKTKKVGEREAENPSDWVIPGYLVMFVFFAAAISAEMIVRERENHTLERLLASSVKQASILGGVFLGTAAKGLVQIAVFWTVGILVFKVDLGLSPATVVLLSILTVIMSAAFGVMLATFAKTRRSAGSMAVLAALVLAPLGGCWWPLFITPKWMQNMAKITPHGWATTGFNKLMMFGGDFGSVVPEMLALLGFALAFGLIAVMRFRTSAVESG